MWLTHILSPLCQIPSQASSLHAVLCMANVVSHTARYEKKLEKIRRSLITPEERLLKGPNVWNVCVIDNIDFAEKTFTYDNNRK